MGVTKGTIYVYFASKEILFEKMVEELAQPSIDMDDLLADLNSTSAMDVLTDLVRKVHAIMISNHYTREILRFLIAEAHAFGELRQKYRESFAVPLLSAVETIIRAGCQNGEFQPEAAELSALVLVSPILGLNVVLHVDPDMEVSVPHYLDQHLGMIRRLLMN